MWQRIKLKAKAMWTRFKAWFVSILVAFGLAVSPLIGTADDVSLTYKNATSWEDGSPLMPGDIAQTCFKKQTFALSTNIAVEPRNHVMLECVGETDFIPGAAGAYTDPDQPDGIHCYVGYHVTHKGIASIDSVESCRTIDLRRSGTLTDLNAN